MKQIKIENNGVEQLITVPKNSKVTIDGNVVVFEPKFKKGDIIYSEWETALKSENSCIGIYDSTDAIFHRLFVKYLDRDNEISINGEISKGHTLRLANIFQKANLFAKLNKEGKQWNAEKLCIEDLKVVPKVGYYFKSSSSTIAKCCELDNGGNPKCTTVFISDGKLNTFYSKITCFNHLNTFKILTESEYAKEYAQLGFEYNFENDTISELKWKPKIGELFYYFDDELYLRSDAYSPFGYYLTVKCGNCFKTKDLCQQAIDKIKQVLSEK